MPKAPAKPAAARAKAATDTLRVLLIRHGKAQRHSESGRDEDRRLKPRGERQAKWLGQMLLKEQLVPVELLHSPVHRAVQTATRLAKVLGCDSTEVEALTLGASARGVIELIKKCREDGIVALVGHNPQLEEVAQILVPQLRKSGVELRTGESLVIEIPATADLTSGKLVSRQRMADDDED